MGGGLYQWHRLKIDVLKEDERLGRYCHSFVGLIDIVNTRLDDRKVFLFCCSQYCSVVIFLIFRFNIFVLLFCVLLCLFFLFVQFPKNPVQEVLPDLGRFESVAAAREEKRASGGSLPQDAQEVPAMTSVCQKVDRNVFTWMSMGL